MLPIGASEFEIVLAIHIMAVVIAFGVTFAYPIIFAIAAKNDRASLPVLHRIECMIDRWLINPGLLVVAVAGVYLASEDHLWKAFFVQWGIGVAFVIGGVVSAVMIPTATKAEQTSARDIAARGEGEITLSDEYSKLARKLMTVGASLSLLVLVTILFMAIRL